MYFYFAIYTYPDHSTATIQGSDLVRQSTDADKTTPSVPETEAEKNKPKVPSTKEPVADTSNLTKDEQDKVKKNVEDANKGNFPAGTTVEVGADGTTKVTYPDHSTATIQGSDLVRPETEAEKNKPKVPSTKEPVADTSNLTKDEQDKVKGEVGNVNPNLPKGTEVEVDDKGNATIKYPDGSKDTIPGSDLVRKSTDADKITPNVPATKVPVTNPSQLTDSEKDQVKTNVTNANKDTLPSGSKVTVGDDGTATITYSDGSKDTIPGRDLIIGAKGEGISGNTAKSSSKNNSLKTLPQTGNGANEKASALGFLFAGLASIFSLAGRRKKKY